MASVASASTLVLLAVADQSLSVRYLCTHGDDESGPRLWNRAESATGLGLPVLRQAAHLPADEISARISAGMKDWIRDAEQYDDLTFIVMKVR